MPNVLNILTSNLYYVKLGIIILTMYFRYLETRTNYKRNLFIKLVILLIQIKHYTYNEKIYFFFLNI